MRKLNYFRLSYQRFSQLEKLKLLKMFSDDIWANGFLLWPAMLNFDSFIVCWNNLHPSFNYTFVKAKVNKDEKRNLF